MAEATGEKRERGRGEGVSLSITSLFTLFSTKTYARGRVREGETEIPLPPLPASPPPMTARPTCERIDVDICGHAVYAGETRCPTCGRRLTLVESMRSASSAMRALSRSVKTALLEVRR